MQTNGTLLTSIHADERDARESATAARQKAEETYFAIIKDPTRTGERDKSAMAAAMKLLGKSANDAIADAQAIDDANTLAKAAQDTWPAQEELAKANADELEFHKTTKLEMQKKIAELAQEKRDAIRTAQNRVDEATRARYHCGAIGARNLHLLQHLPKQAQTVLIPRIGGERYDPRNLDPDRKFFNGT